MNIVIFGPPGAGKGTQAQNIIKKFNLYQVSSGDILRNEIKKKSDIGKKVENIISKGDFATDDIINDLIKKVIINPNYRNRIIFDGYPRTIDQSKNLDNILKEFNQKIDLIISLHVSREVIEKRIIGKITCEKCNITLNEFFDQDQMKFHPCGSNHFIKRKDDNSEILMKRYEVYVKTTQPVIKYLSKKGNFLEIDGTLKIEEITSKIDTFISL